MDFDGICLKNDIEFVFIKEKKNLRNFLIILKSFYVLLFFVS